MIIDFLKDTNQWFSLKETYFIGDKAYDTKDIHNFIRYDLDGHALFHSILVILRKRRC